MERSDEAKRAALNIRTTTALKERLQASGAAAGRTMSQEADLRLEQSFAREMEAGSRSAAILADFVRLAANIIEAQTGKQWTDDADTYFRVQAAMRAFLKANHPPAWNKADEAEAAALEAQEAGRAIERAEAALGNTTNALIVANDVQEAREVYLPKVRKAAEIMGELRDEIAANKAAGEETATNLGHIFRLRPSGRTSERDHDSATPVKEAV